MIVIRIVRRIDGVATRVDGQYVVHYDPTIHEGGVYSLETTSRIPRARKFADDAAAFEYLQRPCPNIPFDSPGHVNRPISCYTVELKRIF